VVRESAWSCAHGVGRWKDDCGCHTGGEPGWNQRWRAPLRAALDLLRDAAVEIAERRGAELFRDVWAARDAYIDVLIGRRSVEVFLAEPGAGPAPLDGERRVAAMTLMEAQRHAMLMYTSCGWFFNDLAGLETVQVMRYAARTLDLLRELGERAPVPEFLDRLAGARSNRKEAGTGVDIWHAQVDPARVDADRVTAHLALVELLQPEAAPNTLAGFEVETHDHDERRHGNVTAVAGRVTLLHGRTGQRAERVYAAAHFQGLDVTGAVRTPDPDRDADALAAVLAAVENGARVSTVLRLVDEGFGPREFGLDSALPDAADQIVRGIADRLSNRVTSAIERLYEDNRPTIDALVTAGYPLPPELRAPAELALARRFEDEIAAAADPADPEPADFGNAQSVVRAARAAGLRLATPRAAAVMTKSVAAAVDRAVTDPTRGNLDAALDLLRLTRDLDLEVDVTPAQERVFAALHDAPDAADVAPLRELGRALHLAV
jgi:hypothetical protein